MGRTEPGIANRYSINVGLYRKGIVEFDEECEEVNKKQMLYYRIDKFVLKEAQRAVVIHNNCCLWCAERGIGAVGRRGAAQNGRRGANGRWRNGDQKEEN
ncbi:MAG: hypothetical protein GY820_44605 [Gammaproteobacteria bacterium]|nr:hypothetical protein [Gammaproteobacteria bacterium]